MLCLFLLPLLGASRRHARVNSDRLVDAEQTIDDAKEVVADIKLKDAISTELKQVLKDLGLTKDLVRVLKLAPKLYVQADRIEKDAKRTLRRLLAKRGAAKGASGAPRPPAAPAKPQPPAKK